ncbi:CRISPR-associated endonuclease Cas1, partial [Candidatus Bathyarchaeota archaeon]|nr:CRISPR-associated endonuclease Cas1 [Candidatus Bathyarchaeota archaeon]
YQTKQSLVYDLQEPFRWIGEVSTIQAFESGLLDMKDFYFMGDDYRYHLEAEAKRRFLELLKDRFNSPVLYKGKRWQWDTIILNKVQELGRFLLWKAESLDFTEPKPDLSREDTLAIRQRTLALTQKQARELDISKSTLHDLRKHAKSDKSFRVYQKVACRLK